MPSLPPTFIKSMSSQTPSNINPKTNGYSNNSSHTPNTNSNSTSNTTKKSKFRSIRDSIKNKRKKKKRALSMPSTDNYLPFQRPNLSSSSSNSTIEFINDYGKCTQPSPNSVKMRSKTYLIDGKKQASKPFLFDLCHVECVKTNEKISNFASHKESWYSKNIPANDKSIFLFIVHFQAHATIGLSIVTYHMMSNVTHYNENSTPQTDDPVFNYLFDRILNTKNHGFRNNRIKFIPRVVSGPYPVRKVIENRPVLIGNKLPLTFFRGKNYFEIDCSLDESMMCSSIVRLCHRFSKRIVVDITFCIQGETSLELPERVLCGCTFHYFDISKAQPFSDGGGNRSMVDGNNNNVSDDKIDAKMYQEMGMLGIN